MWTARGGHLPGERRDASRCTTQCAVPARRRPRARRADAGRPLAATCCLLRAPQPPSAGRLRERGAHAVPRRQRRLAAWPARTVHVCSECGMQSAKWHGQCPGCEAWNTLVEEAVRRGGSARGRSPARGRGRPRRASGRVEAPDAAAGGRRGPGRAHVHGHRRARPRARRRPRAGLAGAARRLAGDRQVDAHEHGARPPRGGRAPHALRQRRGVRRAGPPARRAARRRRRGARRCDVPIARRDRPRRRCSRRSTPSARRRA